MKMNLTSLKIFLCRNDVKIVIICTVTGGILQVLSKQYLKNHPEFLKDAPVTKEKYPRGGALIEISGISIKIVAQVVLNFLAKKGLLAGLATGGAVVISKIPATAVSTYLRDAFPQNLPDLEKKKFILVGGEKIYLDQCDQNLKYLFDILEDETIPFEEKKEIAHSVLTKYLNLKTQFGRRNFALCITFIIYILFTTRHSSFYLMMRSLIKAIREGKITKSMARLIVRRLRKKGIPIDPELAEIVSS
uniref:hypothetical protein n=1 Tax=Nitzschia dubiiformis TaxID=515482 RepID=UPI0021157CC3|nr:hypothetical protein NRL27_pgp025 [Nitzschia dubiiformis]UTQ75655.1 hypothetical protein [Nitzschia dubiiformis]